MKYSVIIPVYNEQDSVTPLHQEVCDVMNRFNQPYEIIFVDDGSKDNTFENLTKLSPVTIIRFRKNFGQTAAMDAGFKQAHGEIFITMDGDGQNDPADIPKLIDKIKEGFDVVSGWRKNRKDPFSKKLFSRGANFLRSFLVADHIKDSGCTLKVYKRECFDDLDLFGEIHRFIPAMLTWKGFRIGEIEVNHRARTTGITKYNWKRVMKGFVDMVSVWFWRKYSGRPLHLFGGLGIIAGGAGLILGLYLTIARLSGMISLQNSIWPLISVFLILAGIQLFISGLLADIAIKTYFNNHRRVYEIKDIIERNVAKDF
ncbi:MAG: glycosyltransferase family 2 protein [bacterium]